MRRYKVLVHCHMSISIRAGFEALLPRSTLTQLETPLRIQDRTDVRDRYDNAAEGMSGTSSSGCIPYIISPGAFSRDAECQLR